MADSLTIDHTSVDDRTHVLVAVGHIDTHTAPRFTESIDAVLNAGGRHVVVDLAQVGFMDSSGLVAFMNAANRMRKNAGDLRVACPSEPVARLLGVTRMDTVFAVFKTREAAIGGETVA